MNKNGNLVTAALAVGMSVSAVCAAFLLAIGGVVPAATGADVSEWDPRMAVGQSTVSNGVRWIDGRAIPIEGRAFDDTETYYERTPHQPRLLRQYAVGIDGEGRRHADREVMAWTTR